MQIYIFQNPFHPPQPSIQVINPQHNDVLKGEYQEESKRIP